jgi:shikimate kinase
MTIVLVGFPGAGKSTIGRRLADKLGMAFIDLDIYIEEKYHTAVPLLFQKYGEPTFRTLEYAALCETLAMDKVVIATGGGAPCHGDAMDQINAKAHSIYLQLTEDQLVERLLHSKKKRPLTNSLSEPELRAYVHETLAKREPFYLRATTVWTPAQADQLPFPL